MSEQATPKSVDDLSPEHPLLVNRIHKNSEGGVDVVLSLSKEQSYILINFAINFLSAQGLVAFSDIMDGDADGEPAPAEATPASLN